MIKIVKVRISGAFIKFERGGFKHLVLACKFYIDYLTKSRVTPTGKQTGSSICHTVATSKT